jgi:hypothetical protein
MSGPGTLEQLSLPARHAATNFSFGHCNAAKELQNAARPAHPENARHVQASK